VHRTAGSLCVFQAFSWASAVSVSEPVSPQPPVTRAVGQLTSSDEVNIQ
jgi:hypothetical protein